MVSYDPTRVLCDAHWHNMCCYQPTRVLSDVWYYYSDPKEHAYLGAGTTDLLSSHALPTQSRGPDADSLVPGVPTDSSTVVPTPVAVDDSDDDGPDSLEKWERNFLSGKGLSGASSKAWVLTFPRRKKTRIFLKYVGFPGYKPPTTNCVLWHYAHVYAMSVGYAATRSPVSVPRRTVPESDRNVPFNDAGMLAERARRSSISDYKSSQPPTELLYDATRAACARYWREARVTFYKGGSLLEILELDIRPQPLVPERCLRMYIGENTEISGVIPAKSGGFATPLHTVKLCPYVTGDESVQVKSAICLRACYAMSGTAIGYGAVCTLALRCPALA
eukprot:3190092-Rhodomonas_salina.3